MLKGDGAGGGGADDYSCILVEQESFARSSAEYRYLLINIPSYLSYLSAVIHPATFFVCSYLISNILTKDQKETQFIGPLTRSTKQLHRGGD